MNLSELQKFDFTHPGHWIVGADRDWAGETSQVLGLMEYEFVLAATSYAMFEPVTQGTMEDHRSSSVYERCLNSIYATSFVFSLDSITKLLEVLNRLNPPEPVPTLISEYRVQFGDLRYVRDSVAHNEDRGRGLDKDRKALSTPLIILRCFNQTRFECTGSDGACHGIDISESALLDAHRILQDILNAYSWE